MAAPTDEQIDAAVPVAGTPNRNLTNGVLKQLAGVSRISLTLVAKPAAPDSPGSPGMVAYDADAEEAYFCVATNTWMSVGLTTWIP